MQNKITVSSVVVGLIIAGTSLALASTWTPPEKSYPDTGSIGAPIDQGSNKQQYNGVIDFSSSLSLYPLIFGANQGVETNGGEGAVFNIVNASIKLVTQGTGITFPDGTKQLTAYTGQTNYTSNGYSAGKICEAAGTGVTTAIRVPDSWTTAGCKIFAAGAGNSANPYTGYRIGCQTSTGPVFGTIATGGADPGAPTVSCGWNVQCGGGNYLPRASSCIPPQAVLSTSLDQNFVTSGSPAEGYTPAVTLFGVPVYCGARQTIIADNTMCGQKYIEGVLWTGAVCGIGGKYEVYCR